MLRATMKLRASYRAFIAGAACLAALYAVPGAQAFTIEDQGGARGGQGFMDLDKPAAAPDRHAVSPFNSGDGQTSVKQGNSTFQFGQQRSFSDRYNTDNIFNPFTREGR